METLTNVTGLTLFSGDNDARQPTLWRPWTAKGSKTASREAHNSERGHLPDAKRAKTPQVVHPVKLYWPKSKCFDYLYQDAEMLLRNYPVQATICPYEDSSSDEESEDEEEETEKQPN